MIEEKPFWLKPPYLILFDLLRLHKLRPWNVDLSIILTSFLGELKEKGYVDFSISGTALLSSSIIHKLKSELILKLEDPPKPKEKPPEEFIPPPMQIPFRFEYTLTSISEILDALLSALDNERKLMERKQSQILDSLQVPTPQLDDFLLNIEEYMEKLYTELVRSFGYKRRAISFLEFVSEKTRIEAVRTFILILFLAHKDRLNISQIDDDLLLEPLIGVEEISASS